MADAGTVRTRQERQGGEQSHDGRGDEHTEGADERGADLPGTAASGVENTGATLSPVDLPPVDDDLLAAEAEEAHKNTGDTSAGTSDNLPSIEFYYGKVKKHGRTIKTGKVYWIFTVYDDGERKRLSPSRIYGKRKGITSIEQCPFQGRILDFRRRSHSRKPNGNPGDAG
jgi:hypothetical protein